MTEKELRRLSRQDLLQMLLAQSREVAGLKESVQNLRDALSDEQELSEQLKAKLDEREAAVEKLRTRLDEKDTAMERLRARLDDRNMAYERMKKQLDSRNARSWGIAELAGVSAQTERPADFRRSEERTAGGGRSRAWETETMRKPAEEYPADPEPKESFSPSVEERLRRLKEQIAAEEAGTIRE